MLLHSAHSIKNFPTKNIVKINVFNTDLTFSNLVTAAVEKKLALSKVLFKRNRSSQIIHEDVTYHYTSSLQYFMGAGHERGGGTGGGGGGVTKDGY